MHFWKQQGLATSLCFRFQIIRDIFFLHGGLEQCNTSIHEFVGSQGFCLFLDWYSFVSHRNASKTNRVPTFSRRVNGVKDRHDV
jgi:hypothetical protein